VLFCIELGSRRVHVAGCISNPTCDLVTQQARQFAWTLQQRPGSFRFLIRDRDSKCTRDFDAVFTGEGIEIIKTPVRAPKANAIAERFVRTVRAECLDWLLILNRRHLERVLRVCVCPCVSFAESSPVAPATTVQMCGSVSEAYLQGHRSAWSRCDDVREFVLRCARLLRRR